MQSWSSAGPVDALSAEQLLCRAEDTLARAPAAAPSLGALLQLRHTLSVPLGLHRLRPSRPAGGLSEPIGHRRIGMLAQPSSSISGLLPAERPRRDLAPVRRDVFQPD